jgi:3-dehydroquinate synthase class II
MDLVAQAIDEDEDVIAAAENAEEAKRALNLLHSSIVKVFAREV